MLLHQFAVSGFAYHLSAQQREALLQLLVQMAGVDHEISAEEEAFLTEWAKEWQLPLELTLHHSVDEDALLAEFNTFTAKIIVLQEMVKLGYQDGHFGEEERVKVLAFAHRLGIKNSQIVNDINRWVRAWFDWYYEGQRMLQGEPWPELCRD